MTAAQPATPGSDSVRAQIAEVCTCGHGRDEHDDGTAHCGANEWCNCDAFVPVCAEPMRGGPNSGLPCDLPRGHNGGIHIRPAVPSEPPAADSPTLGTETPTNCHCSVPEGAGDLMAGPHHHVNCPMHRPAAPSPVNTTEPPAETQQDDEPTREDRGVAMGLVRRARAANSDDEVDAVRDLVAREIATERALAARPSADTETLRLAVSPGELLPGDVVVSAEWDDATEYTVTVDRAAR